MQFFNLLQSGFEFSKDEYELRLKYILFNCLIVCNVTFVFIAGVLRMTTGDNLQGIVDFTYVFLAIVIAFLARRSQKFFSSLVSCIILLSFVIVSLTYKIAENDISGISWFLILTLVAAYLTNRKTTYLLFSIALSLAVYFSVSMAAKNYTVADIIYGVIPLIVALFFTQFYEARNEHSREKQHYLNREFEKQIQKTVTKLSISEEKFRNLIENLSDWVWETDRYGIYSYVSPSVQQLLGYEPHEIKGSSFCSFLSETTLAKTNGEFEWYVAENEPFKNQVVKVRHKDGSTVTLEVSGQPILNRDGDFGGYRGVSRDISMRIKSEDARRESQKKLDTLMNATTDMAFLVDSAGVLLAVNNALAERFGKRKDELVGQSFFEFSLGEAKTVRMAKLQEMIATKQPLCWEDSYDGWSLENSLYPILDDDGNVVQIAVFSKDITRRKQAEEERERLLQAIDQSSETIVITDSGGTIQYVNPAFTTTSGYTSAEALGQNPRILQSEVHGIKFYETMWKRLTGGEPWSGQLVNKKKDGSVYTEEVTISPVRNRAGETMNYVAVKRDISQELKTEQQRIDLEGQLRQKYKMEAVGVMAGGMAHNFNNNLAIILGHIELLRRRLPQDTDFGKYIDNAKVAALRSKDLIQQIMTYSHRGIHDKVSMQLSPIIEETVQLLRSTLPATINLQQQISRDSRHRSVHADGSQIQECLINLCNNAMHAMNESGDLTIFLETVVLQDSDIPAQYESKPGLYAKMSVQDTGCGMSAETIDKIFDLFFTTKGVDEGTGIGLSTVQGIVNQHGGLVKVSSTLGEGTVFELYFPIIEADQTLDIAADHEDFPEGRERILFVDDEEMLVNLGEEMLSEGGYQVTAMTDSMAALSLFNADPDSFDLIITDQTMPELCGSDLIREVKKRRPELPTILCTGYSNKMTEVQAKQQGISAFSLKPFNLSELLQTVRRVLDGE